MRNLYWTFAMVVLLARTVGAGEPSIKPQLRLETGMHTAMIWSIATDAENRYLVTSSEDKTVRVWELATGRLLRVLRPPFVPGNEGKFFSVALSPDGDIVACGGWTGSEWDGTTSIYLFNRTTGAMVRRVTGHPDAVICLAFSPDGRFLVAALGAEGVRVYRTIDYSLGIKDTDYGDSSYGACFDAKGWLATTCFDGFVRLYDESFKLIMKRKAPGGLHPRGIAFSPDGGKLTVGFADSTKVNVLSTNDLSLLYALNTEGVDNGNLASVCWSANGKQLYAGGEYQAEGLLTIRQWSNAGLGTFIDLPASSNTLTDLVPMRSGGVAFGAQDPAFGVFGAGGKRWLFRGPTVADYRGLSLLLSTDGSVIQFGYEYGGKSPARFDLSACVIAIPSPESGGLKSPLTEVDGLRITEWYGTSTPKLNGLPLSLEKYEMSYCLALATDGQRFLLGTNEYLRCFDSSGKERWKFLVPGTVWAVNVARNGQVGAAAFGDGTIRWFRMSDGKELLAFFPVAERETSDRRVTVVAASTARRRWVLWTPSGYYDCSPGAEELIGWHVNRGKDKEADFFPVSQFRDTFYRPDIVAKVLKTLDEAKAVRLANEESGQHKQEVAVEERLPPVVTLVSPRDGDMFTSQELTVRWTARTVENAPVTQVKVLVDGLAMVTTRRVEVVGHGQNERQLSVSLPPSDCEIAVIAENRFAASEPARARVKWQGATPTQEFIIKPKLYVLAVGVSAYQKEELRLRYAAKDALDFAQALKRQESGLYREVVTRVLTDDKATNDDIRDGLEWIQHQTTSKDMAMIFLSGHGMNDETGNYYFVPVNFDPERVKRTGLLWAEVKTTLESLAGKRILFVDTCHSGNVMGAGRRDIFDLTRVINELTSAESGVVVFASSSGRQVSLEKDEWNNGAFTKALVKGLDGKANYTKHQEISINELDLYLSERVKELTGGKQTPTTTKPQTIPDFPVALVR